MSSAGANCAARRWASSTSEASTWSARASLNPSPCSSAMSAASRSLIKSLPPEGRSSEPDSFFGDFSASTLRNVSAAGPVRRASRSVGRTSRSSADQTGYRPVMMRFDGQRPPSASARRHGESLSGSSRRTRRQSQEAAEQPARASWSSPSPFPRRPIHRFPETTVMLSSLPAVTGMTQSLQVLDRVCPTRRPRPHMIHRLRRSATTTRPMRTPIARTRTPRRRSDHPVADPPPTPAVPPPRRTRPPRLPTSATKSFQPGINNGDHGLGTSSEGGLPQGAGAEWPGLCLAWMGSGAAHASSSRSSRIASSEAGQSFSCSMTR